MSLRYNKDVGLGLVVLSLESKDFHMNRMQFINLLYIKNVDPHTFDDAIVMFDSALIQTGIYAKYQHYNPSSLKFEDRDWLTPLSKRWDSLEWGYYVNWLDLVLMDVARGDEGLEAMLPYEKIKV